MRCQSGRWTALIAVAVAVSFPVVTGCKSGSNLVSLPKMPSFNPVSWGKKEAADAELAKKEAAQLPRPSSAALAGPNAAALGPAGPAYPRTGMMPHQPVSGGQRPNDYTYPRSAGGNLGAAPRGQGDPLSPAYARSGPRTGAGQAGGFYDASPSGYERTERTAARGEGLGGSSAGYDYPPPSRSYPDNYGSGGYGDQYQGSRATPGRALDPSPSKFGPNTALSSRADDRSSTPTGYDRGGSRPEQARSSAPESYVSRAYDPSGASRGSSAVPASGDIAYPPASKSGAACSGDSCSPPYANPAPTAGSQSRSSEPPFRPFSTGDLDRSQWLPSKTSAAPQPASTGAPARFGDDTMAQRGYDSYRPPAYRSDASGPDSQSPSSSRDSAFGGGF
jgi:hypothetical protein